MRSEFCYRGLLMTPAEYAADARALARFSGVELSQRRSITGSRTICGRSLTTLLSDSQIQRRGLFRPEAVRRYVDEHRRGSEDWSMQIWQLLTLEIWTQLFLDGGARGLAEKTLSQQTTTEQMLAAQIAPPQLIPA